MMVVIIRETAREETEKRSCLDFNSPSLCSGQRRSNCRIESMILLPSYTKFQNFNKYLTDLFYVVSKEIKFIQLMMFG